MIRVIRDDGIEILLSTDVIESVEDDKDRNAIIKLGTGEIIKAKSPAYDIVGKMKAYWQGIGQERKEYDRAVDKAAKEKEKEKEKGKEKEKEKEKEKTEKKTEKRIEKKTKEKSEKEKRG